MRIALLVGMLLVSGCATFGQMETGLAALMGQNERVAFSVLGYPSNKQFFGSDTVYTWTVSRTGTLIIPQSTTTTGSVGDADVNLRTTYNEVVPVNYNCIIKLATDSKGTLYRSEYGGNIGGCKAYIRRLNAYAKSVGKSN